VIDATQTDVVTARVLGHFLTGCSVRVGQEPVIQCTRGVRQGGLISPLLFTNVANEFLSKYANCQIGSVVGYADDFVMISHSAEWIQKALDDFAIFCREKGLRVNEKKCKAMSSATLKFYREINTERPIFSINSVPLDYVKEYRYLGYDERYGEPRNCNGYRGVEKYYI